jgi:hypothetical protein
MLVAELHLDPVLVLLLGRSLTRAQAVCNDRKNLDNSVFSNETSSAFPLSARRLTSFAHGQAKTQNKPLVVSWQV